MRRRTTYLALCCLIVLLMTNSGCARQRELERMTRSQAATILSLNDEIARLNDEIAELTKSKDYLAKTQMLLQQRLKEELAKGDLTVAMNEKGLVVTVLNKILFDSGKTDLKSSSLNTLTKVGTVLNEQVPDQMIFVEGYTDNDPIVHSNFKSNWELSTARATEVIHYFIDKVGVNPERIVACGYGEFSPVASNDTAAGKQQNRRVEIVISPKKFIKRPFSDTLAEQERM